MTVSEDLRRAAHHAVVAEVAWLTGDGAPAWAALVPLVAEGRLVFALPYSQRLTAGAIVASPAAAVVLSDPRLAGPAWEPLAATVDVLVDADPKGERFAGALLEQELRKHPPSRVLLDSPVLRREYWWYLPRLLVEVTRVHRIRPVGARTGPSQAALAYAAAGSLDADTVGVTGEGRDLAVASLAGRDLAQLPGMPAALFTHDFSIPDRERVAARVRRGSLRDGRLRVDADEGGDRIGPPLGLLSRLRRLRALRRACIAELGAAA